MGHLLPAFAVPKGIDDGLVLPTAIALAIDFGLIALFGLQHSVMALGRLVFALGMTAYVFIGVRYEERDLESFLGEDYRRYRASVPMLVPRPGVVH